MPTLVNSTAPDASLPRRTAYRGGPDHQATHFGGWPWAAQDPNHGVDLRRFARHADGRVEELAAAS